MLILIKKYEKRKSIKLIVQYWNSIIQNIFLFPFLYIKKVFHTNSINYLQPKKKAIFYERNYYLNLIEYHYIY